MFKPQQQKTVKSLLLTLTLTALTACSGGGGTGGGTGGGGGGTGGGTDGPKPEVSLINPSVLFKSGGEVQIVGKHLKDATVGFGPQNLTPSKQTDTLIRVTLPADSVGTKTVKVNQQTNNVVFKDFYTKISSSYKVTCGLLPNKTVECWGASYGNSPKPISGLTDVKDISVGGDFYCALLTDKTVKCWGNNYYGQLGDNTNTKRDTPAFVKNKAGTGKLSKVIKLVVGSAHACALTEDPTLPTAVQCWGKNEHGQLGNNTTTNAKLPSGAAQFTNNKPTDIAAGGDHTCTILTDNKVSCWGLGTSGQLGNNSLISSKQLVEVGASLKAKAISLGHRHSCAILPDNTAKCWGAGNGGRLGYGGSSNFNRPEAVSGLTNVASISAGKDHTCATLSNGQAKCWGNNSFGKLGNNKAITHTTLADDVLSPSGSGLLTNVTSIVAAGGHTCATFSDKPTHCWGGNSSKQLGNGRLASSKTPTPIVATSEPLAARNMYDIKQLSAGAEHLCAVLKDNSVKCWGNNDKGQLGTGSTSTTPVSIDAAVKAHNITNAKQVMVGFKFTCVLLTDKTISCWGGDSSNYMGELGDGNNKASLTPVKVKGINNAIQLTKGYQSICALLEDSTVKCWGNNDYAQIGDGTTTKALEPKVVKNLSNVAQIASSGLHSCALLKDKTVKCWGINHQGQAGITVANTTAQCYSIPAPCIKTPVQVPNLSNVSQISIGSGAYTCALLEDKSIKCWGFNSSGQLGNNSTANSASPVVVSGINNARKLVTGGAHSCALLEDNSVKCWGRNSAWQLGDGTSTNRKVPVNMTQLKGKVDDIFLGGDKTLLIHGSLVVSMGG